MERIKLRPSAAARWMACPASVHLSVGIPESPSGEAAQTGTAIHALAELCWQTEDDPKNYINKMVEGIVITEQNAEFAQLHLDTIKRLETDLGRVLVEQHGTVLNTMQMRLSAMLRSCSNRSDWTSRKSRPWFRRGADSLCSWRVAMQKASECWPRRRHPAARAPCSRVNCWVCPRMPDDD